VKVMERRYLEQSTSRGVTTQERESAMRWLEDAVKDDQIAGARPAVTPHTRPAPVHPRRPSRNGTGSRATVTRAKPVAPARTTPLRPQAAVSLDQVDALRRQQQRIVHRSALISYVLAAETRGGQLLTLGEALAELLADITEAARTMGTILQAASRGRLPNV
jgi:hypothetical protein